MEKPLQQIASVFGTTYCRSIESFNYMKDTRIFYDFLIRHEQFYNLPNIQFILQNNGSFQTLSAFKTSGDIVFKIEYLCMEVSKF